MLLVEDDPDVLWVQAALLSDEGFDVIEATDARQAILHLEQRSDIALLWTDVEMPGAPDGIELARLAHERDPRIGILLSSGRSFPGPDDLPSGARFVRKPQPNDVLIAHVRALLA